MAATPREWGQALHRHITDHGGARLRGTVLHPDDALGEDYDVLVADDATSFLTHRLVAELTRRGRCVLGVFDPDDPEGKERLRDVGATDVIERDADPDELVGRIAALVADQPPRPPDPDELAPPAGPREPVRTGRLVAVAGASGGVGVTEAAVALAHLAGTPKRPAALIDADDCWAGLAQRVSCGLYPNVLAGAEALARGDQPLVGLLQPTLKRRVGLLAGVARDTAEVAGDELADVATSLADAVGVAVLDVAAASPSPGSRAATILARADDVVLVADAAPAGAARTLAWLAAAEPTVAAPRVRVAFNRSDPDRFRRRELTTEIARMAPVAGVWHLPTDARVSRAAWDGAAIPAGAYRQAVAALLAHVEPRVAPRRYRRWPWRRRGRSRP
jgi:MinD-like ATPase involved in chromosome partitioning or flagellar assembly